MRAEQTSLEQLALVDGIGSRPLFTSSEVHYSVLLLQPKHGNANTIQIEIHMGTKHKDTTHKKYSI